MRLNADRASPWGVVTKRALTRLNPATRSNSNSNSNSNSIGSSRRAEVVSAAEVVVVLPAGTLPVWPLQAPLGLPGEIIHSCFLNCSRRRWKIEAKLHHKTAEGQLRSTSGSRRRRVSPTKPQTRTAL